MRIAVIDLGTNTCNLLIAEMIGANYKLLHQSKEMVKLGDGKIRDNQISDEATFRTKAAFVMHKKVMDTFGVDEIKILATSAVRTADNKAGFVAAIEKICDCTVEVISGEREAELIFKGVLLAFEKIEFPTVILDIGGGSNELILTQNDTILWKESRPTGMSRIINSFDLSDPVTVEQIRELQQFFAKEHQTAIQNCKEKNVATLIGCSGAFDTIADMIDEVNPGEKQRVTQVVTLEEFYAVYEKLLPTTRDERLQMKGMDYVRVDLIVPAVILIEALISAIGIKQIVQTDFALREGVLYELIAK
jgi:exopolyphosphatase/guanosine-5'-triphosphate,3'-diphosphate pyrophosphatase